MGKRDDEAPRPSGPFHSPFASLKDKLGALPSAPPQPPKPAPPAPAGPARAVVRMERKGRGGKEVTFVEQLGLAPGKLERWLDELKRGLGCGGTIEEGALVLQGDQRRRAPALLERMGVRKIIVG